VSTFGFLGLLPVPIRAHRERISCSSTHHYDLAKHPSFISEKALIKEATVRPVSVATKAAAGSPHEIAMSQEKRFISSHKIAIININKLNPKVFNKDVIKKSFLIVHSLNAMVYFP